MQGARAAIKLYMLIRYIRVFRSHLHTPEHASTNAANYNEHVMSLYQLLDYSHNPTKTKLFYCTTSSRVNITVH
jgi:hypothetical protein